MPVAMKYRSAPSASRSGVFVASSRRRDAVVRTLSCGREARTRSASRADLDERLADHGGGDLRCYSFALFVVRDALVRHRLSLLCVRHGLPAVGTRTEFGDLREPSQRETVISCLVDSLATAAGTTLVVSSHVMDEARRCDRLVLVREGRISGISDTSGDPPCGED